MRHGRAVSVLSSLALAAMLNACAGGWAGGMNLALLHPANTERFVVQDVSAGGAAERAGLRAGDELLAIDGVTLAGLSDDEVARLGRGNVGTHVRVQFKRGDEAPREVDLERAPR